MHRRATARPPPLRECDRRQRPNAHRRRPCPTIHIAVSLSACCLPTSGSTGTSTLKFSVYYLQLFVRPMTACMKVALVSHSAVVDIYQDKFRYLAAMPGMKLSIIIPEAYREGR